MLNVTLESPDDRSTDLGNYEVAGVWDGQVQGNTPDVGWVVLAMWDHEAEGWRAHEGSDLYPDLYIATP